MSYYCLIIVGGFDVILGRVIFYHSDIGVYDIADCDDSKRYPIPEKNVILLDLVGIIYLYFCS